MKIIKKSIEALFRKNSNAFFIQFFRYFIAGGTAFIVDFSILIFLKEVFLIHYLIAATISFLIALFVNYAICKIWVFNLYKNNNRYFEFSIFFLTSLLGLIINDVSLWFFKEITLFDYRIAKIFATGIAFVWNFLSKKIILFKNVRVSYDKKN